MGKGTSEQKRNVQPKIFNVSAFAFTKNHLKLLSHGTKFTPVTRGTYIDAKKSTEEFTRKLKIKFNFHDQEFEDKSLRRNKSRNPINVRDEEMKQIIKTIQEVEPEKIETKDNLTLEERKALEDIEGNEDIVIKEADKGGALVILDREFYERKMIMADHLNDTSTYAKVNNDVDEKAMRNLTKLVKKHEKCFTKGEKSYVLDPNWKSSEFYVRPKVHKCKTILEEIKRQPENVITIKEAPDLVGRPIIAGTKAPTRHLSDLISDILKPIVLTQTSYVKDDWDYLRKIPRKLNGKYQLFGCDIKSLYTSIPHELGIEAIQYWIDKCRHLIDSRFTNSFIIESVEFLLKNNNCTFGSQFFQQLQGTAMGASFAAFYACLTIGYLEETKLYPKLAETFGEENMEILKETYRRFMDDGIVFLPAHIRKDTFLSILNEMHPAIEFTLEESESVIIRGKRYERLNFLDISILIDEDGFIHTDIYYKPTNSHDYLHYGSFHPEHTLKNIPFCLAKRIVVFCSNEITMKERLQELRDLLKDCNYPPKLIEDGIRNAQLQGPAPPKTNKTNTVALVHQNMSNYRFSHILSTTRHLLENAKSDEIRNVFKDTRFVEAMRQPKSIIRTISTNHQEETVIEPNPGLFAECAGTGCELCSLGYIQNCTSFTTSSGHQWQIKSHINCNSRNVLYYLECSFCKDFTKTGKTDTRLRLRLNNHKSDCKTGRTTDVFDLHVHKCGGNRMQHPYFRVKAFMKLSSPEKLLTYEKLLHERKYATINS